MEVATEMGYVVKPDANSETSEATILTLSLSCGTGADQAYLTGISEAALEHNIAIMSHHYRPQDSKKVLHPESQPRAIRTGPLDGIILLHRWPEDVVRQLRRRYPICSVIHTYPGLNIDVIGFEEREGMQQLMQHLVAGGHKKIGFFGYCTEMSWSRSRHAAYVENLGLINESYHPEHVIPVTLTQAAYEDVFPYPLGKIESLISQGVTAWVAASETLGYSLVRALLEKDYKIPADVCVTGFHAQTQTPYGLPKLTSTDLASEEIGRAALRRIVNQLANPNESHRTILLPSKISLGATTPASNKGRQAAQPESQPLGTV
jgi:LacI family transcriptional regulator